ncbi:MAG: HEAT repeat domain-containing protein, partial [Chloroflexi bacterium]|nr:HEAT repeat domain-containing protein [Chloroflexota bacterium]
MTEQERRQRSGQEPALSGQYQQEGSSGYEPGLAIDAAVRDVIVSMASIDAQERAAAIDLLVELGEKALLGLLKALKSEHRDMRLGAMRATGVIADERMVPHMTPLLTDPDEWVRWATAVALFGMGEGGQTARLDALRADESGRVVDALASADWGVMSYQGIN